MTGSWRALVLWSALALVVVLIGVSTGGPRTLEEILPALPEDFPWPVLVANDSSIVTWAMAKRRQPRGWSRALSCIP